MDRRTTTVFGGSGFIGRHLVRRLAARGDAVRVAVRDTEGAVFLKPMGDIGQIVPVGANIRDAASVAAAVAGADAVVNLVGILAERGDATFENVHHHGAANIARAAADAGVKRLVHISAIGASKTARSDYAASKAAGEAAVHAAFPDATILRPSIVFGPEDNFFNLFAGLSRVSPVLPVFGCPTFPRIRGGDGKPFRIDAYGDGGTRFQPVYVGDVADAIMAALERADAQGRTFELGGPRVYSSKALMDLLLSVIERRRILWPVPFWLLSLEAWFLEKLPGPLLTRDQVRQLRRDNVVAEDAAGLKDLGVSPTAAEAILPTYLGRYRHGGRHHLGELPGT